MSRQNVCDWPECEVCAASQKVRSSRYAGSDWPTSQTALLTQMRLRPERDLKRFNINDLSWIGTERRASAYYVISANPRFRIRMHEVAS